MNHLNHQPFLFKGALTVRVLSRKGISACSNLAQQIQYQLSHGQERDQQKSPDVWGQDLLKLHFSWRPLGVSTMTSVTFRSKKHLKVPQLSQGNTGPREDVTGPSDLSNYSLLTTLSKRSKYSVTWFFMTTRKDHQCLFMSQNIRPPTKPCLGECQ